MERLQRGQDPRFSHSSLEHTLQKVWPHGMKAAPFFLPMHTQHIESFPTTSTFSSSFSFSTAADSPPSLSSSSLISDTLHGVPGALPASSCGPRICRSAASAAAKFIPEAAAPWSTQSKADPWPGSVSWWLACCCCSPWVKLNAWERNPHVAPQQPMPMNPKRSLKVFFLRAPGSTPSIWSLNNPRMVLGSLCSDSCNTTPSWLIAVASE